MKSNQIRLFRRKTLWQIFCEVALIKVIKMVKVLSVKFVKLFGEKIKIQNIFLTLGFWAHHERKYKTDFLNFSNIKNFTFFSLLGKGVLICISFD